MNAERCAREDELLHALGNRFVGAELDAHAASCASCGELRVVAGALLDDRAVAMLEAPVPSAGTMWWRMQMRRRHDAQAAARRSLFVGQAVTLAIALALVVALAGADIVDGVRHAITSIRFNTPLLITLATWLLLAPIAGWVAIRQK